MEQKINYLEEKMAIMQHELAQMSHEVYAQQKEVAQLMLEIEKLKSQLEMCSPIVASYCQTMMCRHHIIEHPPSHLISAQFWQTLNSGKCRITSASHPSGLEMPWQPD